MTLGVRQFERTCYVMSDTTVEINTIQIDLRMSCPSLHYDISLCYDTSAVHACKTFISPIA